MMWGKHYASTYEGSMVGSGAAVFAVWGYVISKMQPDNEVGAQVELNPKLLAFVIGEPEAVILKAIERLCAVDKNSRTPDRDGRRLIKIGQFAYRVVNGAKYLGLKNLDEKRAGDRERKQKERSLKRGKPQAGEMAAVKAFGDGDGAAYQKVLDGLNPVKKSDVAAARSETDSVIPEIPTAVQGIGTGEVESDTESGRMVDGEWVPD